MLWRVALLGVVGVWWGGVSCTGRVGTEGDPKEGPEGLSIVDGRGNFAILGAYRDSLGVRVGGGREVEFALFADGTLVRRNADGGVGCYRVSGDEVKRIYASARRVVESYGGMRANLGPDASYRVMYVNSVEGRAWQVAMMSWHEAYESERVVATQYGLEPVTGSEEQDKRRKAWSPEYRAFREAWAELRKVMGTDLAEVEVVPAIELGFERRR